MDQIYPCEYDVLNDRAGEWASPPPPPNDFEKLVMQSWGCLACNVHISIEYLFNIFIEYINGKK